VNEKLNFKRVLSIPSIYSFFVNIMGKNFRATYVNQYIKPKINSSILDIGCGPADTLAYLPLGVDYVGFDFSEKYIKSAKKRFRNRGRFYCKKVSSDAIKYRGKFDIVLSTGVLHHLSDDEALQMFELAKSTMKSSGRFITFDGCFYEGQSRIARYLLQRDRGCYVRNQEGYLTIAKKVFPKIDVIIRHDLLRFPYTHIIMECTC
jgi:cyclopropane fatty-acyl-phospholipid synthase-like methyltransferase